MFIHGVRRLILKSRDTFILLDYLFTPYDITKIDCTEWRHVFSYILHYLCMCVAHMGMCLDHTAKKSGKVGLAALVIDP